MLDKIVITPQENRIRKLWLFTIVIQALFAFIPIVCCVVLILAYPSSDRIAFFEASIFLSALLGIHYGLNYVCAYKKYGTAWLFFCLVMSGFSLALVCIGLLCSLLLGKAMLSINRIASPISLFNVVVAIWTTWLCYQLRKVNINIRNKAFLSSEGYQKVKASFASASNSEELRSRYLDFFAHYSYSKIFDSLYKERKIALLNNERGKGEGTTY